MSATDDKPTRKGRLMSQKDVSEELGLPTRDVLRYARAGKFPEPVQHIGKKYRFRRSDVLAWEKNPRAKRRGSSESADA